MDGVVEDVGIYWCEPLKHVSLVSQRISWSRPGLSLRAESSSDGHTVTVLTPSTDSSRLLLLPTANDGLLGIRTQPNVGLYQHGRRARDASGRTAGVGVRSSRIGLRSAVETQSHLVHALVVRGVVSMARKETPGSDVYLKMLRTGVGACEWVGVRAFFSPGGGHLCGGQFGCAAADYSRLV